MGDRCVISRLETPLSRADSSLDAGDVLVFDAEGGTAGIVYMSPSSWRDALAPHDLDGWPLLTDLATPAASPCSA